MLLLAAVVRITVSSTTMAVVLATAVLH
jgi:hypothetical protein